MLKIYMYRESYTKKLFLKLLEKKLYVKVMSIIKSYPTSLPSYIFIEVVLKTYLDKLYFHKLYAELMHQNCVKSYLKKYTESCTQKLYDEFRAYKVV